MISIGIRVTCNQIYYCIAEDNEEEKINIISISEIKIPKAVDDPCKLSFIRNTFETIIEQYKVSRAGIKVMENNARLTHSSNILFRLNMEGVILELFSSSSIEKYIVGVASNIASALDLEKSKPVKDMIEDVGIHDSHKTDNGKKMNDENKESIITAIAALCLKG